MLPLILDEGKVFIFKFWFGDKIQEGMSHRNELFCRLRTFDVAYRPQVYHFGCKLAQDGVQIALTSAPHTCSLWISLRTPAIEATLSKIESSTLPFVELSSQTDSSMLEDKNEQSS